MLTRAVALCLVAAACRTAERPGSTDAADAPAREPASVSAAEFRTLAWLEGTWRGSGGGIDPFYERYRFVDDSTLLRLTFTDSTLAAANDSARIALRGGRVIELGDVPKWQAVEFDSTSWRFESLEDATRAFTWRREGPDRWTAVIEWRDSSGPKQRVYSLERLRE